MCLVFLFGLDREIYQIGCEYGSLVNFWFSRTDNWIIFTKEVTSTYTIYKKNQLDPDLAIFWASHLYNNLKKA